MGESRRGRISRAVYVRTVGQMLTRDWYTLESCEVLTQLDIVAQLVAKYPDRYPSVGWAVRGMLDKAISSIIALCQARPDQASQRLAAFLEARRQGKSVTAIAREWDLSREYVSRTVGRQAILLVTEKVLAISRLTVIEPKSETPARSMHVVQQPAKHSA